MMSGKNPWWHCHLVVGACNVTNENMADSSLELYSITAPGLEQITATELGVFGAAAQTVSRGGVAWHGSLRDLYRANLWLRTATRVLVRVSSFHAGSFAELERRAKQVPWGRFVRARDHVRFRVTCHKSALYHSGAVAERLAESVSAATGCATASTSVPDATGDDPGAIAEQLFVVRIDHDTVTLSADSSGTLLHKRGYRQASAKAPMRETLAAAMLLSSGWDPAQPLLDPMCGSGTIPIEAALIARKIAPGLYRDFRFARWPGFDQSGWNSLREEALSGIIERAPSTIAAADRDAGAVAATKSNAERAGVGPDLQIVQRSLAASEPGGPDAGWLITNPPYGVRIGTDVRNLYAKVGALMRTSFSDWRLGILTASPVLERQLGIPLERVFEARNGGIPVRFMVGQATRDNGGGS
jgi:putative N6-adenine-specific DNA methylase